MERMRKSRDENNDKEEGDSNEVINNTSNDNILGISNKTFVLYMTHFSIVLYALCYWIQIGVLPYLTRKLGVDAATFGILQSVFSFVQLCGGPIYGRFGDLFGGKYSLILAFFACFTSYGLLAVAASIPVLFLSRLPSIGMHCMQGAQMVVTDITSDEERASAIGRLGVSYGVGMVIGPLLGGFITDRSSEQMAAASAAVGSILSIVLVILFIPGDTKSIKDGGSSEKKVASGNVFDLKKYSSIFVVPNFMYVFLIKVVSAIPIGVLQAMFSIVAMDYFHLDAKGNGLVLSYVGIMGMLVQGFVVGFLTRRYSDLTLIKYSIVLLFFSYLAMMFVTSIYAFLVVLIPLTVAGAVLSVIITSVVTKTVPVQDTGAALGLMMATHSLIRTVSPTIGGFLYGYLGFSVFGVVGTVVNGALSFYLFNYGRKQLEST